MTNPETLPRSAPASGGKKLFDGSAELKPLAKRPSRRQEMSEAETTPLQDLEEALKQLEWFDDCAGSDDGAYYDGMAAFLKIKRALELAECEMRYAGFSKRKDENIVRELAYKAVLETGVTP